MGHRIADESDVTSVYSPHDPDYCLHAKQAIDAYCQEVNGLMQGPRRLVIGTESLWIAHSADAG